MERQEFGQREELAQLRETPLAQPIEVHFALREEEVVEGVATLFRLRGGHRGTVGLVFLAVLLGWLGQPFLAYFIVAFVLFLRTELRRQAKKTLQREPLLQEPVTWHFSDQEVTIDHPRAAGRHDWSVYKKVIETPNLFMLFPQDNLYNPIPKRAFANGEEMDRFREMIREWGIELRVVGKARQS